MKIKNTETLKKCPNSRVHRRYFFCEGDKKGPTPLFPWGKPKTNSKHYEGIVQCWVKDFSSYICCKNINDVNTWNLTYLSSYFKLYGCRRDVDNYSQGNFETDLCLRIYYQNSVNEASSGLDFEYPCIWKWTTKNDHRLVVKQKRRRFQTNLLSALCVSCPFWTSDSEH